MDALLAAVRAAFASDLADQVRALEAGLVALERAEPGAARDETLRGVFRAAHGLKGSARAAGFPRIEATCHAMESLLGAARDRGRVLSADDASALLGAVDALREAQRRMEAGEEPEGAPFDEATGRLEARTAATATPPFDSAPLRSGRMEGEASLHAESVPAQRPDDPVRAERSPAQPGGVEEPRPTTAHAVASTGPAQPRRSSVRLSPERLDALAATGSALIVTAQQAEARADRVEDLAQEVRRLRAELRVARPALARLASRRGARPTAEERAARGALAAEERLRAVERGLASLRAQVFQDGRSLAQGTRRLTAEVRALRLAPWHDATAGLERIARDLARELGKDVEVTVGGEGLEVDGAIVDALREPLAHLVRNAVDHGIERPADRAAAGKPARGRIEVGALVTGERVLVRVSDDGRGLDPERLREAARARGLPAPVDDARALALVFQPGFSTRDEVTAVSGRGVGLDAVAAVVRGLRGEASVSSLPGRGATFELALPATLYGLRAVLVRDAGQAFAVSALDVERVVRLSAEKVRTSEGRAVLLGGQPLPLAPLAHVLGLAAGPWRPEERRLAVVLAHGGRRAAFAVEDVLAERELSLAPLGPRLAGLPLATAVAMLPGGDLAVVLSAADLLDGVDGATGAPAPRRAAEGARRKRIVLADDAATTRALGRSILEAAGYEILAAPDGEQAWALLQQQGADLVVSDVEMPGMTGFDLARAVRASPRFAKLPVVLLTALETDADRQRGLEAGADAYLVKSGFDQRELLATVAQLLGEQTP